MVAAAVRTHQYDKMLTFRKLQSFMIVPQLICPSACLQNIVTGMCGNPSKVNVPLPVRTSGYTCTLYLQLFSEFFRDNLMVTVKMTPQNKVILLLSFPTHLPAVSVCSRLCKKCNLVTYLLIFKSCRGNGEQWRVVVWHRT